MVLRCLFLVFFLLPLTVHSANLAPVIVTTVVQKPFNERIEALGTLSSNEAIILSATVTDTISAVHFEDGQRVSQNDILVEMTSKEEHAQLEEARYALGEAERQYQRVKSLAKTNLATESLLDERKQAFQAAESQLLAMQSRMEDRLIIAPFAGVLGLRDVSVGALLRPGDSITTLDDDSSMKLDMNISAVFLSAVKRGLKITAQSREFPGKVFLGEITAVDSRIDPNTRSIIVRARLNNPNRELKTGMLMTVDLQKSPLPSLLLPEQALVQEGFRSFVYRIVPGETLTVDKVEVETGARQSGSVVVRHGLNEGDRVVTHGVMRLKSGAKVVITAEQQGDESLKSLLPSSH